MELNRLTAISPIDGRYGDKLNSLQSIFSESGLIQTRLFIEIRWLQTLSDSKDIQEIPSLTAKSKQTLENIIAEFSENDAKEIKKIEKETNHDVKAIEYFLKNRFKQNPELDSISEFIHFACTSEDINNLAYSLMLKRTCKEFIIPHIDQLTSQLKSMAHNLADTPMLAHTHGQPATPTTMGKELANFAARLQRQYNQITKQIFLGKFNGAVGNYNAHHFAYPNIDWETFNENFVTQLGLEWNPYTTQIEPHDTIAEFCHTLIRTNTILINLTRDIWRYISLNYFKQKLKNNEVGSSTMPHKINPIDFENAEGNLGISNTLLNHFATKLPISRLQRDLTDSTVLRNLGVSFAHAMLAYQSIFKGLNKLEINTNKMVADLNQHWEIIAEAIQTVMRRYRIANPYEKLKSLTQGKTIDKEIIHKFIDDLSLPADEKNRLKQLTPQTYLGKAIHLAKKV